MPSPWSRLPSKWKVWLVSLAALAALVAVFSAAADQFLRKLSPAFSSLISEQFKIRLSFEHVRYVFPNRVVLKEVRVIDPARGGPLGRARLAELGFSFPVFSRQNIRLNSLVLRDPSLSGPGIKRYLERNAALVVERIKSIPRGNMRVVILGPQVQLDFRLRGERFYGKGFYKAKAYSYAFNGQIGRYGMAFDKIIARGPGLDLSLWGNWQDNGLEWKGYVLCGAPLARAPLYVLDIDGRARLKDKHAELERLSFSLNEDHVTASGNYFWAGPRHFAGKAVYARLAGRVKPQSPLQAVVLEIDGGKQGKKPVFNARAEAQFLPAAGGRPGLQKLQGDFKRLKLRVLNMELLQLEAGGGQLAAQVNGQVHKAAFTGLRAQLHLLGPPQKNASLSAQLYGGRFEMSSTIDTSAGPWQVSGRGKIENVDANRLSGALVHFEKCKGRLSGDFSLRFPTEAVFAGTLSLPAAEFGGLDFLRWISANFQMPALERLTGADFSCHFRVTAKEAALENFHLRSKDLDLQGFYRVNSDDLVASRISARFSKEVLEASPSARRLMSLAGQAWQLPFEFQLSGDFQRMNFEWEDSPLKAKVQRQIPDFIQNLIDRRMNK